MFHLDNSETSWLVYADWLEDQDIDASHIRESVIYSSNQWDSNNQWHWAYLCGFNHVGDAFSNRGRVADNGFNFVGTNHHVGVGSCDPGTSFVGSDNMEYGYNSCVGIE